MERGEGREEQIGALVRQTYEDPRIVCRYTEVGLWPGEESLILDFVPDGARLLDLGCGGGRAAIPLAEMGLQVAGIDVSGPMVELARQQAELAGVEVDFSQMDARQLRFPDCSFDAALCAYNGIELLPGREGKLKMIREVWRVLSPGGCFIFSAHSIFALNQFAPARFGNFLKFVMGRILRLPIRERELGERFLYEEWEEAKYLQVLPPSSLIAMLGKAGFELAYFNTRKRLEKGKPWRLSGCFEDGERFFVARKPAGKIAPPS